MAGLGTNAARSEAPLMLLLVLAAACCCGTASGRRLFAPAKSNLLNLVHYNDVHNRIEQTSPSSTACTPANEEAGVCLGGWGRIASFVNTTRQQAKDKNEHFLVLDAGDQFDGTLWDVVYRGGATWPMQNIVKPDVMTLGNHEFTFPPDVLRAYITNLTSPMIGACNVDTSAEPLLKGLVKKWQVFKLGQYKVAVLGWLTQDTAFTAANVGKVKVAPVNPSVKACVAALKKEHPDVHMIIGLSHTGYNPDIATAKAVPELDLIVGGHSHTFLHTPTKMGPMLDTHVTPSDCMDKRLCDEPQGPYPTFVNATLCKGEGKARKCSGKSIPVVQAYYASKYIGNLTIDLATKKVISGFPVLLGGPNSSSPWPQDPRILAEIERLAPPVAALEKKPAGLVDTVLIGGKAGRVKETNFGSYVASLMAASAKKLPKLEKEFGPIDIAVTNAGSIRANIEPTEVHYGDVLTAMPFRNTLSIKTVTGQQLREILTRGVSGISEGEGFFLQVAGVRVFHRGNDLVDAKLLFDNGTTAEIDPKAKYNVATLDYMANGGDGYKQFKNAPPVLMLGNEVGDLMMRDLESSMPKPIKVPDVTKTRRIIDCEASYVSCLLPMYRPCCTSKMEEDKKNTAAAAQAAAASKAAAPAAPTTKARR